MGKKATMLCEQIAIMEWDTKQGMIPSAYDGAKTRIYKDMNMNEESSKLAAQSLVRAIDPIKKAGYMDGAAHGQVAAFQPSFDIGYSQGFIFGLQLGLIGAAAVNSLQNQEEDINGKFSDSRKINCQLCINGTATNEKVNNLYNVQEENNVECLRTNNMII